MTTKAKTAKPRKRAKPVPAWKKCPSRRQHSGFRRQARSCPECGFPPEEKKASPTRKDGRKPKWTDKETQDCYLEWLRKGAYDAAAARAVGWDPSTVTSWHRWVKYGRDSGGRERPAPPALIEFIRKCGEAKEGLYREALEAVGDLVKDRDRVVVMRVLARQDKSWREDVGVEHSGRVEGGLSLSDVHEAARLARSVEKKGDSDDERDEAEAE